jgi:hypothetical protein
MCTGSTRSRDGALQAQRPEGGAARAHILFLLSSNASPEGFQAAVNWQILLLSQGQWPFSADRGATVRAPWGDTYAHSARVPPKHSVALKGTLKWSGDGSTCGNAGNRLLAPTARRRVSQRPGARCIQSRKQRTSFCRSFMELAGLEPATSWVRSLRSRSPDSASLRASRPRGIAPPTPFPTSRRPFSTGRGRFG